MSDRVPLLVDGNTQVSISNSILKHFGLLPFHKTHEGLDEILSKNPNRKICLFLFDGFGKAIQKQLKRYAPTVYAHGRFDIQAVYPPTTVAATTSVLTGKYPIETGWLGWTQRFDKTGEYIQMFPGTLEGTDGAKASLSPRIECPTQDILGMINAKCGEGTAASILGFQCIGADKKIHMPMFEAKVDEALNRDSLRFLYAYWTEPDHSMHVTGINTADTHRRVEEVEQAVVSLTKKHPETLFLSIADHGHILIDFVDIREYPDFIDTLEEPRFSIEPRFASFRVKPGKEEAFAQCYETYFSKDFAMMTKEEVLANHLFGFGTLTDSVSSFIGNRFLIATGHKALSDGYNFIKMVSTHAGVTDDERWVELGVYND